VQCYFSSAARCAQVDDNTLDVTELPVRKWTQDYKEYLETLIKPEDKVTPEAPPQSACTMCATWQCTRLLSSL